MGAQNLLRVLTEAWLAGYQMDLGSNGTLKWLPEVNNTGTLQIGDGSFDIDFKVFLGDASTYFHLDVGDQTMYLSGVTFDIATAVVDTLNTNTLNISGTFTVNTISATTINATITLTVNTLNATSLTLDNLTVNTLNTNTLNITNTFSLSAITATAVDVAGPTNTQTLLVLPATDDTGTATIGNATHGIDFQVFAGGAQKYFLVDRGNSKITIKTLPIDTNANVTVNANVTITGNVIATDIVCNSSFLVNGPATLNSFTVVPSVDDTGAFNIGNATLGIDFKVFLGGAQTYFSLDRGDQTMYLRTVQLDTNAVVSSTADITSDAIITGATVNATTMNVDGVKSYLGNGYWKKKYTNITANTSITAAHYSGFLKCSPSLAVIDLTLPNPSGLEGVWIEGFLADAANDVRIFSVNTTSQLMAIAGDASVNTITVNSFGSAFKLISYGTKWLFSPYDGATFSTVS